ncbi:PKD domain-containing protein [Actinoplanes philippinensis]|uniref:PKD domain-containing protein n=1 Tax=Actinoplanes philippinensis TaxID=35752 RepID=UPI003406C442
MRFLRHRALSALTTVVLGAGGGLAAGTPAMAADSDVVAPVGRYQLDFTSLWDGQSATLTALEVSDDVSGQQDIRQYVDWGDGDFSYLDGDQKSERHQFFNPGSYTVTVRVTDRAGNSSAGVFEGTATVTVARVPGTYRIATKEVYSGDPAIVTLADIPSDVTKVRIWWGDGKDTTVSRTTKQVKHYYSGSTSWYVSVLLTNAAGESYGREIGSIYTTYDETAPQISLTKPKKPTYVSSWRTVNGKVSDRGRGTVAVGAAFIEQRGSSWYYYTGKKWIKAKSLNQALKKTRTIQARPTAKNTWQIKIKGLKKGTLYVFYAAVDKDGNESEAKVKKQKLTR